MRANIHRIEADPFALKSALTVLAHSDDARDEALVCSHLQALSPRDRSTLESMLDAR
ncbi:MAG: hypothetical protein SGI72_04355 [Planctomycetota bacterium]|nr:hypothetical protein [Planctomycetota bacterium]